jgi:SAM-dependent methyltransferase
MPGIQADGESFSREERLRHAASFGAVAAAYADHRPSYADAAIRWCLEPAGPAPRVVDLGAGTGILTGALARLGADVTAIEPDPEMLAELRRRRPGVRAAAGYAEQIPLPDASVDAVLAGQAMHWFDLDRALPEIARVLVPGGVLAGLWNVDDDRVGWVAELAEMSRRKASNTLLRWRNGDAQPSPEQFAQAGAGLFTPAATAEFPNAQRRTADSLVATIATHSHVLVMDISERAELLAHVSDFLHSQPETSAGEFTLPMLTIAVRVTRRPAPPA